MGMYERIQERAAKKKKVQNHTMVDVVCAHCGKGFKKQLNQFNYNKKKGRGNFCSHTCGGRYYQKKLRENKKG